jgi:hypothetical protein
LGTSVTLKKLERAAMEWYRKYKKLEWSPLMPLYNACESHDRARKHSKNLSAAQRNRYTREQIIRGDIAAHAQRKGAKRKGR